MMGSVRYATYTTTPTREARRMLIRWALGPYRWGRSRIEGLGFLAPLWERYTGPDYLGWRVRYLHDFGALKAGDMGVVTESHLDGRRRQYVVEFPGTNLYLAALPEPQVALLGPPQG